MKKSVLFMVTVLLFGFLLSSCGMGQPVNTPTSMPTLTPLPTDTPTPTNTPIPTLTPTVKPTAIPLPDPTAVLKENGFIPYSGDFKCSEPGCKSYIDNVSNLVIEILQDGSKFSFVLNGYLDIGRQVNLLNKMLTALYPTDFVAEIMGVVPRNGNSGDLINYTGGKGNYDWFVSGVWGFYVEVDISPK
jgi:hypothetical protein